MLRLLLLVLLIFVSGSCWVHIGLYCRVPHENLQLGWAMKKISVPNGLLSQIILLQVAHAYALEESGHKTW